MKILTLVRLAPIKVPDHLIPMVMNDAITCMTIARYATIDTDHPKIQQVAYGTEADAGSDGLPKKRRLMNQLRLFWLGIKTQRRENADVIYGIHFTTNGVMAYLIARMFRKKCLVSLIGTDLNKHILEYPIGKILLPILKRVDAITVFDDAARDKLIAKNVNPEKIFVMPHAIKMDRFSRRADVPQDLDAVFIGMFVPLKELERLLVAWRLVLDQYPRARMALVGDGVLREKLEEQAQKFEMQDNVIFTGWVEDVPAFLSRARIFVNVSNQEGVPHAMLEAMACELVPVVTAVGGVPSVIRDGENGFLVNSPADPAEVASCILRLLRNPSYIERMRYNAVQVRESHTYEAISEHWTPVFEYLRAR